MRRKKPIMSFKQRAEALKSLIDDCVNLGINPAVIEGYKIQLNAIEKEISEFKEKQKKFREDLKKIK